MMSSEFIRWDELDLDDLLGEWTDDGEILGPESEWDVAESDGDGVDPVETIDEAKENAPKKARNEQSKKHFYCPICPKKYVTTSGFRGHVMKKHNRPDLKAHLHQKADTLCDIPVQEVKLPLTTAEEIKTELPIMAKTALQGIRDDPVHNLKSSRSGGEMVEIAKSLLNANLTVMHALLFTHLISIITTATNPAHIDVPKLLSGIIGQMKFNKNFITDMCETLRTVLPTNVPMRFVRLFVQRFILEFVTAYARRQNELLNKIRKAAAEALTDNDKQVLFYICGYLVHALRKHYFRVKSAKRLLDLVSCLQCRDDNPNTLPSSWTDALDRGGLKKPNVKFFNLIVQVEKWVREIVSQQHLGSDSLINLKANLMDYGLLKVSWQRIFTDGHPDSTLVLLEHVLSIFLKVRGFAITKLFRKTLHKQNKSSKTGRSNKSLRKNLKDLNNLNL